MFGCVGCLQFDIYGEGIIIIIQGEMMYYFLFFNQQLFIESQFVSKLVDNFNVEIVLGNVCSCDEGVEWFGYIYFFVCMFWLFGFYSVGVEYEDDEVLEQKCVDLIYLVVIVFKKLNLIKYDEKIGKFQFIEFGCIVFYYYIINLFMDIYNKLIQLVMNDVEFFCVFVQSGEFKYILVC